MRYCGFILLLTVSVSVSYCQEIPEDEWVDPGDMLTFDPVLKKNRKLPNDDQITDPAVRKGTTEVRHQKQCPTCPDCPKCSEAVAQKCSCDSPSIISDSVEFESMFIKRLAAVFQRKLLDLGQPPDFTEYDLRVELDKRDWNILQDFIDDSSHISVQEVTEIIENSFKKVFPTHNDRQARWRWKFEDTFLIEVDDAIKFCVVLWLLVAILSFEVFSSISWSSQLKRFFVVMFLLSFIWTWRHQYQLAVAESMSSATDVPEHCKKSDHVHSFAEDVSNIARYYFSTGKDPCVKYHEAYINPILKVPPTKILAVTISGFVFEPLSHMGAAFSKTFNNMFAELPVQLWIPAFVFVIIAMLAAILLLTICFGYSWNLHLPFWSGIEIGPQRYIDNTPQMNQMLTDQRQQIETLQNFLQNIDQPLQNAPAIEAPPRQGNGWFSGLRRWFSRSPQTPSASPPSTEPSNTTDFPMPAPPPTSASLTSQGGTRAPNLSQQMQECPYPNFNPRTVSQPHLPYPPSPFIPAQQQPVHRSNSSPTSDADHSSFDGLRYRGTPRPCPVDTSEDSVYDGLENTHLGNPPPYSSRLDEAGDRRPTVHVGFARHVVDERPPSYRDDNNETKPMVSAQTSAVTTTAEEVVDADNESTTSSVEVLSFDHNDDHL
ncbi:chloride channel CLIC-like protein 1 [Clavelina lepadiformis]|uniref:chloride channel CLIC-like protein 1 n=1 Tax=Clavelina lepadiformis TaxID=159417 RepID=UPI004041E230